MEHGLKSIFIPQIKLVSFFLVPLSSSSVVPNRSGYTDFVLSVADLLWPYNDKARVLTHEYGHIQGLYGEYPAYLRGFGKTTTVRERMNPSQLQLVPPKIPKLGGFTVPSSNAKQAPLNAHYLQAPLLPPHP